MAAPTPVSGMWEEGGARARKAADFSPAEPVIAPPRAKAITRLSHEGDYRVASPYRSMAPAGGEGRPRFPSGHTGQGLTQEMATGLVKMYH